MKRNVYWTGVVFLLSFLSACGGGSSGGGSVVPPGGATSGPASASGLVVDYDTASGLGGVTVSVGPWHLGATPSPVTTTAPDGSFTFTEPAGDYEIRIGSDDPTDTRTTLVQYIVLSSGSNQLRAPIPSPQPYVTPDPVQTSGHFRLKLLAPAQQACLQSANQEFAALNAGQFSMDEYIWESERWMLAQTTQSPSGALGNTNGVATLIGDLYQSAAFIAQTYGTGTLGVNPGTEAAKAEVPALQANRMNVWRFAIDCDPQFPTNFGAAALADVR